MVVAHELKLNLVKSLAVLNCLFVLNPLIFSLLSIKTKWLDNFKLIQPDSFEVENLIFVTGNSLYC